MPFMPHLRQAVAPRRDREEKSVLPAFANYYAQVAGFHHMPTRDWPIERAVAEGYDRVMWVFKAVNTIAADSARLPYRLREGIGDDAPMIEDHPLYSVMNKKANPLETGQVFRKRLSAQIMLSKRGAFVEVTKSNGGTVTRLDLLPPDRVRIVPGTGNDLIDHFELSRRDGSVKELAPERVRWFRDPHPIDPFMGTTPLESAGMSIELDHFARLYNVTFMQNDGRPGGVLAVRKTDGTGGDIDERQMDRIESRFGKGPAEAGKLSVIAGDLSYVDLATRPRDMQYGQTSRNAKIEILSAFGIGESVLGYAAERTFDNADNELYVYWTRTMPAHNEVLLTGLDEDSEDDLYGYFDTSSIEVLERAARTKREEARTEVDKGLRSLYSYARLAGYEDEIEETPHTRALYIPSGKTPLPSREEDAEALGLAVPVEDETGGEVPGGESEEPGGPGPAVPPPPGDAPGGPGGAPEAPPAPGSAPQGAAARALAALAGPEPGTKVALRVVGGGGAGPKAGYRLSRKSPSRSTESRPDLAAADAFEAAVAAALTALTERWVQRAAVRVGSPKQRKHTRHWTPEFVLDTRVGTKALDAAKSVDEDTWQSEAEETLHPLVEAAAIAFGVALLADMAVTPPPGTTLVKMAAEATAQTVTHIVSMVGKAAATQARRLITQVNAQDQDGADLDTLTATITGRADVLGRWADNVAVGVATATMNGSRDDAAREANRDEQIEVERVWFTRRDARVRDSHVLADGQIRGLDEPFIVGESLLRFPHDPLAPVHETANCRCYLRHRATRTGQWMRADAKYAIEPVEAKRVQALRGRTRDFFGALVGREPRDGDGDGWVYDGTPRMRPAPVRGSVPTWADAPTVAPEPEEWDDSYVIRPGSPLPAERAADTAARLAEKLWRNLDRFHADPALVLRLQVAAADYDEAVEVGDHLGMAKALEALLEALEGIRDMRTPDGAPMFNEDDLGGDFQRLDNLFLITPAPAPANAKTVYTGQVEEKAQPIDGDGDGFVYDGTPRQRLAPPTKPKPLSWRRRHGGYLSSDREWLLDRMAPMAGGTTNGWAVYRRTPADRIARDTPRGTAYDPRTGTPLVEHDGVYYHHEADATSYAEARAYAEPERSPEPEPDYRALGAQAAAGQVRGRTPEQVAAALASMEPRLADTPEGPAREALEGAIEHLRGLAPPSAPRAGEVVATLNGEPLARIEAVVDGVPFIKHRDDDFDLDDSARQAVADGINEVLRRLPGLPMPEVNQTSTESVVATASRNGIMVGPSVMDRDGLADQSREWRGISLSAPGDPGAENRIRSVLVHEMGHFVEHALRRDPDVADAVDAIVREQVTPRDLGFTAGDGLDTPRERYRSDPLRDADGSPQSAYANENPQEWFAEAFADAYFNGDRASEASRRIMALADRHLGGSPAASNAGVRIENLRKVDGFDSVYEGTVADGAPPVWRHIGDRRELVEAIESGWTDWDAAKGGFTARPMEGDTQFASTRDQALAWEHPQRRQSNGWRILVSADVSGLPVRFIGRTERDDTNDLDATFTEHGDGTGTFAPNTVGGLGVVGRIPLDRIRSVEVFSPVGSPVNPGEEPRVTQSFASAADFAAWVTRSRYFDSHADYEAWVAAGRPRRDDGTPDTTAFAGAPEPEPVAEVNPLFGQRESLREAPGPGGSLTIMERLHGRRSGQTVDRVLWRVEKRDGVWGVYGPHEQVPASFQSVRKADAERWARNHAEGKPDPADRYAELRRTGGLLLSPEEREESLAVIRRMAKADGLHVVASLAERSPGMDRSHARRRPTHVNLVRPESPTEIYAPDA